MRPHLLNLSSDWISSTGVFVGVDVHGGKLIQALDGFDVPYVSLTFFFASSPPQCPSQMSYYTNSTLKQRVSGSHINFCILTGGILPCHNFTGLILSSWDNKDVKSVNIRSENHFHFPERAFGSFPSSACMLLWQMMSRLRHILQT